MNRKLLRTKGSRFCEVTIRLEDGNLSITGAEGRILTRERARKGSLNYWQAFFEESPEEIAAMNARCGTRFRSPKSAAQYVLEQDGEFHGLDVLSEDDKHVYVVEGCGQIVDVIRDFFPDLRDALPWHLNDMRAGCEHQDDGGPAPKVGEPCPTCGYKYGSAWLKRELPAEIVLLAKTVGR